MSAVNAIQLLAQEETWQQQLQTAIRSVKELTAALELPTDALDYSYAADREFPLLVPRAFVRRMRKADAKDPLLRQILASEVEMLSSAGYSDDPVGESSRYATNTGIIRKYTGRALMILTGQCAVNCRYCFRRHYPYSDTVQSSEQRRAAIEALLDDRSINELILSGGDPMLLPDHQLAAISDQLASRARGITLRIHSRLPVVIPDRITSSLLDAISRPEMPVVMVLHINHPNEIDVATARAITRLREAGITVLNQAVLLATINDDVQTLAELSDKLFAAGALPYYLHMLDKVRGAAHFEVSQIRARRLLGELASSRPGYLVPKLAMEVAGASSKQELAPLYPV